MDLFLDYCYDLFLLKSLQLLDYHRKLPCLAAYHIQLDWVCSQVQPKTYSCKVTTAEALPTDSLVSRQLFLQPPLQNSVFLNSHKNSVFLHSRKRPTPVRYAIVGLQMNRQVT